MRRLHSNVMTGISLLLFVAVAVLWVRSYFVGEVLYVLSSRPQTAHLGAATTINLGSHQGGLFYFQGTDIYRSPSPWILKTEWGRETVSGNSYPGQSLGWRDAQLNFGGFMFLHRNFQLHVPTHAYGAERALTHGTNFGVVVPHWAVVLVTSVPAALLTARWRRQARRRFRLRHQLCLRCGYDLRATLGDRCPECGEPSASTSIAPGATT